MILAEGIAEKYQSDIQVMDFETHEKLRRTLKAGFGFASAGLNTAAMLNDMGAAVMALTPIGPLLRQTAQFQRASADFMTHYLQDVVRVLLDFEKFTINGAPVRVTQEQVFETPFGHLTHLKRQTPDGAPLDRHDPVKLIFVPHSGHRASLTQDYISYFAQDHDVYYVEMNDANEIPVSAGEFGYHDAIDFYRDCMVEAHHHAAANGHEGRVHSSFICQPGPPAFIAAMMLARENAPERPASITALASPFDTRRSPTMVNEFANSHDMAWFAKKVIQRVPEHFGYAGEGRLVYPGYIQRMAFIAKNAESHGKRARDLFGHMAHGRDEDVARQIEFDQIFLHDIASLTQTFYLETVRMGFRQNTLASGEFRQNGILITGAENRDIPLLAIEGAEDDITGLGQCKAMLDLCVNLSPGKKRHFVLPGKGHYGVFAGSGLKTLSGPAIVGFIRNVDSGSYSPPAERNMQEPRKSAISLLPLAA